MPNPRVANPRVAERAPWRSTKRGVAGVCSLLQMPTDSCHFPCTSDTLVRPQNSLARKALSATRGLARGGLGTRQIERKPVLSISAFWTTVSPHDAFSTPFAHPRFWATKSLVFCFSCPYPKDPSTKNTMALGSVVFCYYRSVLVL